MFRENGVVNAAQKVVLEYFLGTKGHSSQSTWWHGTTNRHQFQERYLDLNFEPETAKARYQKIHITMFLEILYNGGILSL